MPTDDELRRVAEDVRALARSLARDLRGVVERAREDNWNRGTANRGFGAAERAVREEARMVRAAIREAATWVPHQHRHRHRAHGPGRLDRAAEEWGPGWGHWSRHRGRDQDLGVHSPNWVPDGSQRPVRMARRPPAPPPPPRPALLHRHDGSTLLGLLAVVFGLAWLAAGTHLLPVPAEGVLAVALMLLGGAMVLTARTDWALSRRSWPMMAGALLVVALVVSSASPSLGGGFRHLQIGSRTRTPKSWADLPAHIPGGIGRTVVDLTAINGPMPSGQVLTIDGSVGGLTIEVPARLPVVVDGRIGAGTVTVDGMGVASGFRQSFNGRFNGAGAGADPALALHVNAGVGSVVIETHASAADPSNPSPPLTPPKPLTPPPATAQP